MTLVEMLVTIAVVATLIGLLVPSLALARNAARSARCIANHSQLSAAWTMYTNDYGVFPYGLDTSYKTRERFNWGGVDWYPGEPDSPGPFFHRARPLNPYVGEDAILRSRNATFKCPFDIGAHDYGTNIRPWEGMGAASVSGETSTCFGIAGTSYEANTWMYSKPESLIGWGPNLVNYRSNLGPQHVQVDPSRFVFLQDIGPANWLATMPWARSIGNLWGEWWHGPERQAFGFMDGSARIEKGELLVCSRYSLRLVPLRPANGSWRFPDRP